MRSVFRNSAGAALLVMTSCRTLTPSSAPPPASSPVSEDEALPSTLSARVEQEYVGVPALTDVHASVPGEPGIVLLRGSVTTLEARDLAVQLARETEGVRAVLDEMELRAPGMSEERLDTEVRTALEQGDVHVYRPMVHVQGGSVTLTGRVTSVEDKERVAEAVRQVAGVNAFNNQLTVTAPEELDAEIRDDAQRALEAAGIDLPELELDVMDGRVAIRGELPRAELKPLMERALTQAGIELVEGETVQIAPTTTPTANVAQQVADRLRADPRTAELELTARFDDGLATLEGTAPSADVRHAAELVALAVPGVFRVENRVDIVAQGDAREVAAALEDALARDTRLAEHELHITVDDDSVTLRGEVESQDERTRATEIAGSLGGGRDVDNRIIVRDDDDSAAPTRPR